MFRVALIYKLNEDVSRRLAIKYCIYDLNLGEAFGKDIKIQVSNDAKEWTDVAVAQNDKPGLQSIYFDDITARYVRMLGISRGSGWGYSLWSFQVFGSDTDLTGLSPVHFIKLQLKNKAGEIISDNFYWRGNKRKDFTALNFMAAVQLKSDYSVHQKDGRTFVRARVSNPVNSPAIAFAVRVQAVNSKTGQQILPAIMSSNYFSLLKGESKQIQIDFDSQLLKNNEKVELRVTPYNNN